MAQCFSIQIGQGFPSMATLPLAAPNNRFLVNFVYISTSFLRPRMVLWTWCGKILSYLSNFIPFPQYQSISINITYPIISCLQESQCLVSAIGSYTIMLGPICGTSGVLGREVSSQGTQDLRRPAPDPQPVALFGSFVWKHVKNVGSYMSYMVYGH
jgi:hypothetical protein